MAGLPELPFETATIAGVDCHTPAWTLTNSHVLRDAAPRRRQNVKLAGRDGWLGRRSFADQRTVNLEFWVIGDVDSTGDPYDDSDEGVELNIEYLRANLYRATEDAYGSTTCSVVSAAGTTYAGPIQLDDFEVQPGIGARWVFIQATLPNGELVATP